MNVDVLTVAQYCFERIHQQICSFNILSGGKKQIKHTIIILEREYKKRWSKVVCLCGRTWILVAKTHEYEFIWRISQIVDDCGIA